MKNKFLLSALIATSLCGNAANDPVLMTVNGKDVKLSEFEYMYQKNNKQQIEKESLNDYVDRFVVYKLKVAAAEDAGLDTTKTFINELNGHKNELMRPYLDNNKYAIPYAKEAYERMKKNLTVSHIMLQLIPENKQRLDSIRGCILKGEDFAELAKKYSTDVYSAEKGGDLGGLWVGRYPYSFEDAAYKTPVGKVSEVVETAFGYHIIKVTDEYPTIGKYRVAHILKLYPQGANDSVKNVVNAKAESIYKLLKNGADFASVAKKESEDGRSANNGGDLGWFGKDQLVKHIEEVVLKTPVGDISEPIFSEYGVHILKVVEHKPMESYDEMEAELLKMVNRDDRGTTISNKKINDLKAEYNFKLNPEFEKTVKSMLEPNGYDSTFVANFKNANLLAFTYKGGNVYSDKFSKNWSYTLKMPKDRAWKYINDHLERIIKDVMTAYEKDDLVNKYPEYANLLNEYREGLLLFEISNRNVWDKASTDKEGLEKYFTANKKKYTTWKEPKFKGLIIYMVNDSVENAVKDYMKSIGGDTIVNALHKKFRRDIRIERHLTAKGENQYVDELIFDGAKASADKKYAKYFVLEGKVINQPEEVADVRGLVTTDYQNKLEKDWIKELKSKYKVKINKKVLKLVKE